MLNYAHLLLAEFINPSQMMPTQVLGTPLCGATIDSVSIGCSVYHRDTCSTADFVNVRKNDVRINNTNMQKKWLKPNAMVWAMMIPMVVLK
jgi:hypothetical protein